MPRLTDLAVSFARHQKSAGRSQETIKMYRWCLNRLFAHIGDDLSDLTRRNLTDYYGLRMEQVQSTSAAIEFQVARVFCKWLISEEEITASPMASMKEPKKIAHPVPILSDAEIAALLTASRGSGLRARRDAAIITLAVSSGLRRGEIANLRHGDIDLNAQIARVDGKTGPRIVPFDAQAATALDRFVRRKGEEAAGRSLFGLTASGVGQAFKARAEQAGIEAHIHMARHTFAHRWMAANGSETDLLTLGGWSPGSRSMLDRYGASARVERAIAAYRRLT